VVPHIFLYTAKALEILFNEIADSRNPLQRIDWVSSVYRVFQDVTRRVKVVLYLLQQLPSDSGIVLKVFDCFWRKN
jgi:hypothetical protein